MYFCNQKLINEIAEDGPDPHAANALQEGLGGQFGEMRTFNQYFFQSMNFRGKATAYRDLIHAVAVEEISHMELIGTTINRLLDGAPGFEGKSTPGAKGTTPLEVAFKGGNIHHFLVSAQGAMPIDSAGNPWSGSYVYASGNLCLDLLYNLMLECTGRLQKCRIYEMTKNRTARSTIAYLIVRDHAHENVFAKALESLGVDWGKILPIPSFDATKWPEVNQLMKEGLHLQQYHFRLDNSELAAIFNGKSPSGDGELSVPDEAPIGVPIRSAAERLEEFSPGLSPELQELADAAKSLMGTSALAAFDDQKPTRKKSREKVRLK